MPQENGDEKYSEGLKMIKLPVGKTA